MSIVTDALNRLQSMRAHAVHPTAAHDPAPAKSSDPEPHEEQHESRYDTKFLTVSIGSFLVIATMAMGAFWWGESFVEGVPQLSMSASSHAVEPLESVSKEPVDLVILDQSPLTTSESTPLEQKSSAQETEGQEAMPQVSEEKNPEQIVSLSRHDQKEAIVKKSQIQDEVSESSEGESEIHVAHVEQQLHEPPSTILNDKSNPQTEKSGSSTSPDMAEREIPSASFSSTPVSPAGLSQSDSPTQVATRLQSEKNISESIPTIRPTQSSSSLPSVTAKNPRPSSQTSRSQVQTLARETEASVTQVQSRLSPEQRLVKARLLIEQQSHAEALTVLNPLFATLPDTWEPWFWMGTAQLGVGNLEKAENAFMEGLVRDDSVPYLWVQRAVIEQQRGQYRAAMDALRQAELLAPDLPEVQLNLAYNLEHQGNPKLARRHYQQYLSLTEGKSTYHGVRRKVLERVIRMGNS